MWAPRQLAMKQLAAMKRLGHCQSHLQRWGIAGRAGGNIVGGEDILAFALSRPLRKGRLGDWANESVLRPGPHYTFDPTRDMPELSRL